ncbi:MAG: tRNA (N(6)-L-threonylcarbamoyladenosine(37)-C(2))-methylthiotransferase MtaB [Defluviitaleaceae bacterium]|nr:tRNA (N(6)-L-threonylcarbamoyladenosine(37)-C(2))-methylthiotransferase MtaB [Defluviitaleaceae bacterium]
MRDKAPTVATHTLGCKVNKCDTDALLTQLTGVGYKVSEFSKPADIYIINTCTVTHAGDKKSLQMIRRARRQNSAAFIAVCGCMPRGQAGSAESIMQAGADFVFDTRKPEDLLVKLEQLFTANTRACNNCNITAERTRAFIKIQDGCDRFCAYCIVPYVRGPVVSRPIADILAEADACIRHGALEIVLTGIQVAAYGYDTGNNKITLPLLIKRIAELGPKRLRLSSIDPWAIDDDFIAVVSDYPTLCSHFHLSLQSGADATLARMNRRYTTAQYASAAAKLKNLRPDMALTTDIIVGFPGESDNDFEQSLQFVKHMGFSRIHVFEYSPRAGTPAADMPDQVPSNIKATRGQTMRATAKSLEQQFLNSQVGKQVQVLFESECKDSSCEDKSTWQGHTGNYCLVKTSGIDLANNLKYVRITGITNDGLGLVGEF